jgi:uncharacterized membrane protein YbhN (UPF0104 family)
MSAAAVTAEPAGKQIHWKRWLIGGLTIVVIGAAANLLGWDIAGWFGNLWDTLTAISAWYLVAAIAVKTLETTATAFAWYSIVHFAYGKVSFLQVLACYAASVALNTILPANLGTLVLLVMLSVVIAAASFAGVLAGYAVQKIFFVVIGAVPYIYLFLTVGGSFSIRFGWVKTHPWGTAILAIGAVWLIVLVLRMLWPRLEKWWDQAKHGGQILGHPGAYFGRVFVPEAIAWLAGLAGTAIFLAAYGIPVSFHTLMRVLAGNSLANVTSATPGGAGVNQAFSVASLKGIASSTDATAYSITQQVVTTAWSIVFAIILMAWAFGWSGAKSLVGDSVSEAKEKEAEQKAEHAAKKEAKKEAKHAKPAEAVVAGSGQTSGGDSQ